MYDDLQSIDITIRLDDEKIYSRALLREEEFDNSDYLSYALRTLISEVWDEIAKKGYINGR